MVPAIDANGTLSGNSDVRQRSSPARNTPARIASAGERGRHGLPSSVIAPCAARTAPKIVFARRDLPPPTGPAIATISPRRTSRSNGALACVRRNPRTLRPPSPGRAIGAGPSARAFGNGRPIIVSTAASKSTGAARSATIRPSRTIATRSAIRRRSPSRCDTSRTATPSSRNVSSSANRRSASGADRLAVGSSRISRPGCPASARASVTRCWSASESDASGAARSASSPTRSASGRAASRRAAGGTRHGDAGSHSRSSSRLSAIDSVGTTASATD